MDDPLSLSHTEHTHTAAINLSFPPLSSKCSQCNAERKENAKNLIVCIEGASTTSTNVTKLFAKIDLETTHPKQDAFYSSGFRKRPNSSPILNRVMRAIDVNIPPVALDIKEIIKDAYRWLAERYQDGDQIFLFGFSRGAYQVRVLAGMIHEIGLIKTRNEDLIATAYEYCAAIRSGQPKARQIAREFKNTHSWKDSRVHFVGVWDSISSVGLTRMDVFLSTSESSPSHACHIRHALALDENRVKFKPDYVHQMNTLTEDGKSKYIVTSPELEHATTPGDELREFTANGNGTDLSGGATNIKEVWFAGWRSDVGGKNRPGTSYQAGNVSLLWMRREAAASGLVLKPTDIVWFPDDLTVNIGYGGSDFLTAIVPTKHRWWNPPRRRIIPGQKVHASILYAGRQYGPCSLLGQGFDIPFLCAGLDTELDDRIWETALFDGAAVHELVTSLGGHQGIAPVRLDRLLFLVRFQQGRQCIRNVPGWENQFMNIIKNRGCAPLVWLVIIAIYHEVSCDPEAPKNLLSPDAQLPPDIFDNAKETFLASLVPRDSARVVALLRPLTNNKVLWEQFLTQDSDVLETLVNFLDAMISRGGKEFGLAMDALDFLLQCDATQKTIIEKLGEKSRLLLIMRGNAASLRMLMTLVRIPAREARDLCCSVKPKIRELARTYDKRVGLLAVEILLALYDGNDKLDIYYGNVRANLARALVHLNSDRNDSATRGQQILRRVFGLDANQLNRVQKNLIGELKSDVQQKIVVDEVLRRFILVGSISSVWGRTVRTDATLTLLKLCENKIIRAHLLQIDLLDEFVNQLQWQDTALFAAYALAACLRYSDMKDSMMKDNDDLAKNIVRMLQLDYFDDAIGQVEGFRIFGDLMQHAEPAELREKIKNSITEILIVKLAKGKSKETRTGLICLEIFRSYDHDDPWTRELVDESLKRLRNEHWTGQKAGVTILSALAQTKHGVAAICPRIHEIIEMLLPEGSSLIHPNTPLANPACPTSLHDSQTQPAAMTTVIPTDSMSPDSAYVPRRPSKMIGPACALRILVQNEVLRDHIRQTMEYDCLKRLFLSATLVGANDLSLCHWAPARDDIIDILDNTVKVVNEESSDEGPISIEDVLPHLGYWDRLVIMILRVSAMRMLFVIILLAYLSVPALIVMSIVTLGLWILGICMLAVIVPIAVLLVYLFLWISEFFKRRRSRQYDSWEDCGEIDLGVRTWQTLVATVTCRRIEDVV